MELIMEELQGIRNLGIDTSPIIYFVEKHPKYDNLVTKIFQKISNGEIEGWTSVITLTEVLIHPIQQNNETLKQKYSVLLLNSDNFNTLPIDADTAKLAAELRSKYQIRTPDALQIACSITHNCEAFLTNDLALEKVGDIKVLILEKFLEA